MTRITGTLHEELCTFMVISRYMILRMRNYSDKSCGENQNRHFVFNPPPETRAVYEIMWKNVVESDRPKMTIWCMRFPSWITKARIQIHA
jgi:hypothetical protein